MKLLHNAQRSYILSYYQDYFPEYICSYWSLVIAHISNLSLVLFTRKQIGSNWIVSTFTSDPNWINSISPIGDFEALSCC